LVDIEIHQQILVLLITQKWSSLIAVKLRYRLRIERDSRWIALAWMLVMVAVVCAVWGRIFPSIGQLPGDLGDTRWNMFSLESGYQWISGNGSLWNMKMFWPLKGTSSFSDMHLGSLIFYAIPRLLGLDKYAAMQVWFAAGLYLTLFSAYLASRWMKYSSASSALVALVFTCALPVTAQVGHVQLSHRWAAPWAIVAVIGMSRSVLKRRSHLFVFVVSICFQFLLSPGTAIATIYISVVIWIVLVCLGTSRKDFREVRSDKRQLVSTVSGIFVVITAVYVALRYSQFQKFYGITREKLEVWEFSPTLKSLFLADHSHVWNRYSYRLVIDSGRSETQLFVGLALIAFLVIGISGVRSKRDVRLSLLLGGVLVFITTIRVGDSSVFIYLANIPGFDSVRTPGRFMLILLFPIGLVAASGFDTLVTSRHKLFQLLAILLLVFMVREYSKIDLMRISKSEINAPTEQMVDRVSERINSANRDQFDAFFVLDDAEHNRFMLDLDAMAASQELQIPTLNGYTGFIPFGYENVTTCKDLDKMFDEILKIEPEANLSRVAIIGGDCG
jgi:hypothetical protein